MHCILISFFNSNNLGDLLLSDAITHCFMERNFQITRCSMEGSFSIRPPVLRETPLLKKWLSYPYHCVLRIMKRQEPQLAFAEEYARRLAEADCVVIAGGNLLMEHSPIGTASEQLKKYIQPARALQKPIYILFAGAGPFYTEGQKQSFADLLNACQVVSFRDKASLLHFQGRLHVPCSVTPDPAFLLDWGPAGAMEAPASTAPGNARIALNIMNMRLAEGGSDAAYIAQYATLAKALLQGGHGSLTLFSTERNDYPAVRKVYAKLKRHANVSIRVISRVEDLQELYRETDLVVGTRMHALILAYTQCIPMIGLAWQEKVLSFFQLTGQRHVYDIHTLSSHIPDIIAASQALLADREAVQAQMKMRLLEIREEIRAGLLDAFAFIEENDT